MRIACGRDSFELNLNLLNSLSMHILIHIRVDRPHDYALFYFMVSISDEYKFKRLVKTAFKSCGKPIFLEIYHTRN